MLSTGGCPRNIVARPPLSQTVTLVPQWVDPMCKTEQTVQLSARPDAYRPWRVFFSLFCRDLQRRGAVFFAVLSFAFPLTSCTTEPPKNQYADKGPIKTVGARDTKDASAEGPRSRNQDSDAASFDAADASAGGRSEAPNVPPRDATVDAGSHLAAAKCGSPPVSEGKFSKRALRHQAVQCAAWHACEFETVAERLYQSLTRYEQEPSALPQAQEAWRVAMRSWSVLELFQFGPLASRATSAGKDMYHGQGIRDRLYSWPLVSRCRVEEQLVGQEYKKQGFDNALVSGRGLFALESLLFYAEQDTECAPASKTGAAWDKLSATEINTRKRTYARAVSEDILSLSRQLVKSYSPYGENFTATFVEALGYPSEQEAMNVLGWSLIYLEREVKDYKLGTAAGYILASPVTTLESPFAYEDATAIASNLNGFRALFQGCGAGGEGLGFDDWLKAVGHGDLSNEIIERLAFAERVIGELMTIEGASQAEREEAYLSVKAITDLLKTEVFGGGSPLNLKLPASVASDTD